ncbi:MAG: O-antigen ligase family protein, partial [Aureliella sp.]
MLDAVRPGLHQAASWSARLLLLAMVAAAPWYYGSARWPAQVVIVYASLALAALTWLSVVTAPRSSGKCARLVYCMLAFLLLIALQLVHVPSALAPFVSAVQRVVGDTTTASAATPIEWLDPARYNTVSILPEQTRASLAVFCAAVVAVWSASVLFVTWRWATALAITIAVSGTLNAFLGLVQAVSWNDWTLLPRLSESSFSTFVSRNSAATYFASVTGSILTLLGVAYRSQKRRRRQEYRVTYPATNWLGRLRNRAEDVFIDLNSMAVVCISAATFMIAATLATLSRGGTIACIGAGLVTLCLSLGTRGSFVRAAAVAAVVGAAVIGMLTFLDLDTGLINRMDQINEAAYTGKDGRLIAWGYTLRSLAWYWPMGSGYGTFHFALLPFHDSGPNV